MVDMVRTALGSSVPMLPDDGSRDVIKPDIWIKLLRLSPYEAGKLLPQSIRLHNPATERLKTLGHNVKLPRLFDLLEISVCSSREQSILLMTVLAHNREISLAHRIILPSQQTVDIIVSNVFVADTRNEVAINNQTNTVEQHVKMNLYALDNTTIEEQGMGRHVFADEDQNFKLNHPLLCLLGAVSVVKERETSNVRRIALKPHGVLPLSGETDKNGGK